MRGGAQRDVLTQGPHPGPRPSPCPSHGLMTLGATLAVLRWVKRMALHLGRGELLWDTASAPCLLRHLYLCFAAGYPVCRGPGTRTPSVRGRSR